MQEHGLSNQSTCLIGWSQQQYAGFVPSERYLSAMLKRDIEADEHDANQHTAIIAPDQIAIDDSHKVRRSMQFHLYK